MSLTPAPDLDPLIDFWQLPGAGPATALFDEQGRAVSRDELSRAADAAAARLLPGRAFALTCAPTLATVATWLGALRRGAVPLMLDAELSDAAAAALRDRYRLGLHVDGRAGGEGLWHGSAADGPATHPDLALLMSTSGSTASPKLVRLSRRAVAANATSIVQYLSLQADDVAITTLPLHYSYGLSVLNSHLAAGACVALSAASVTQAAFWSQVREQGVTHLAGVPTLWRMLRRLRFERMALPSLRTLTQAGGRLEPDEVLWLQVAAQAHGRRAFVMYGQTEATARIAYLPPDRGWLPAKAGAIGVAIPGGRLQVLAPDGQTEAASGTEGELVYTGPNVMMGYAEQPADLLRGAELAQLRTGDLGRIDADGCAWVTGRLKRFIKMAGHRINLDEIEAALRDSGLDAGVCGHDDSLWVGLAGASDEQAQALALDLARRYRWLPAWVRVRAIADLPRASNGKLQYAALRAQLADEPAPSHA